MIFIALAIIGTLILALIIRSVLNKDKADDQKKADSLEDDRIYNEATGRYLTLEEAENEIIYVDDSVERIKSDEEIEKNYSEEVRGVEYAIRHMLQLGTPETEDDRLLDLLDHSGIFESCESYNVHYVWEIRPEHFLGIVQISYTYGQGKGNVATAFEWQVFGIVQGELIHPLKKIKTSNVAKIGNTAIFRIEKQVNYEDFKTLLQVLSPADQNQT